MAPITDLPSELVAQILKASVYSYSRSALDTRQDVEKGLFHLRLAIPTWTAMIREPALRKMCKEHSEYLDQRPDTIRGVQDLLF